MPKEIAQAISGKDKFFYFHCLDSALETLISGLKTESSKPFSPDLIEFGRKEKWDWRRVTTLQKTYETLAMLTERVRQDYSWFNFLYSENPEENRGHFKEVTVGQNSGMPWIHDLADLHRLRSDADKYLKEIPSHQELMDQLRYDLNHDEKYPEEVLRDSMRLHAQAMDRNFLEKVKSANLIEWESQQFTYTARKVVSLGSEELWSVGVVKYSHASEMFEMYVLDVWQDSTGKDIAESSERITVSPELLGLFNFASTNAAWYMLQKIDEKFDALHPVHINRAMIGPLETRFAPSSENGLPAFGEIVTENQNSFLMHFKRQYSYAPNVREAAEGRVQQIVYQEDWNDHYLVCPPNNASKVAASVLGTNVRLLQ